MIKILKIFEKKIISGGFNIKIDDKSLHFGCLIGKGPGTLNTSCYDSLGKKVRGYAANDWQDADDFCCHNKNGDEYFHLVVGKEYKHCKTGDRKFLSTANPEDLTGLI